MDPLIETKDPGKNSDLLVWTVNGEGASFSIISIISLPTEKLVLEISPP